MSQEKKVRLNIEETVNFLKHIFRNNRYIQENKDDVPVAVNIEGPAGIGKTSAVEQLALEMGVHFVKLNLAEFEEIGDLVGFPLKEFLVKDPATKEERWIIETEVLSFRKAGWEIIEKRMGYAIPKWVPKNAEEGGILFLDDYTRSSERFMQATMTLIDRQKYGSWGLPKNWHIVLSTNPSDGEYHVTELDDAQKTRFLTVESVFDAKVWAKWAESINMDSRCINFVLLNEELVKNARAYTIFFKSITSIPHFEKELPLIQQIGASSVGETAASMFTMFINNKLDKLPSPGYLLDTVDVKLVDAALGECIGTKADYRADIAGVLATRIINLCNKRAGDGNVSANVQDRIRYIITECPHFSTDLQFLMVKEIIAANKTTFASLLKDAAVANMVLK